MRPLAFTLVPREFLENSEYCRKSLKIVKNLNFAIWKKVFSNFIGPPRLNRERQSALVFFYWTTTDKLEFADWSEVQRKIGSGEIAIFRQGGPFGPPPCLIRVKLVCTIRMQYDNLCIPFSEKHLIYKILGKSIRVNQYLLKKKLPHFICG